MRTTTRYTDALRNMPASGGGGCHVHLLTVANLGVLEGVPEAQIFEDLRATVHGTRHVSDREIRDVVIVHDVEMHEIGTGVEHGFHVLAQPGEIRGENRGSDKGLHVRDLFKNALIDST